MADALILHQTLHGYGEGHRLIAGSVSLPPPDARSMLILSNSSGGEVRLPAKGYLTGYPLGGSGKYVLARTWAAPEMSRPGCVWTHSLLIDFSDLARLVSVEGLDELFHPPDGKLHGAYKEPLEAAPGSSPNVPIFHVSGRRTHWSALREAEGEDRRDQRQFVRRGAGPRDLDAAMAEAAEVVPLLFVSPRAIDLLPRTSSTCSWWMAATQRAGRG